MTLWLVYYSRKINLILKKLIRVITKNYVKSTIRWTKTDKTDAKALANIWIINKNNLFTFNKNKKFIEISKKISLISTLEKQIQSLKKVIKSFNEVNNTLELSKSNAVESIEITINELEENIKNLQKEVEKDEIWWYLNEDSKNNINIINSITWVSDYIAKVFFISFAHKNFESKESMYAFIWFDPKLKDSWSFSWKACISKRWNSYIRKKLFQSAFCATQHCKLFKDIYEKQKLKWKHHFTCVISVIKKMVYIMFSLLKNKTLFNPLFASF